MNKHRFFDNYGQKEEVCVHIRTEEGRERGKKEEKERRRE